MPAHNSPKIMFWNAQSITNKAKQIQLNHMLDSECIDLALIAESFLKPPHPFHIPNFTVYRNDRIHQPHGGVAIAIRNTIEHKICSPFNTQHIENIAIEIKINNTPTYIIAAYSPKYSIHLANDIQLLTPTNSQFMLFADLNAKHTSWNCNNNNKSGNILFNMQQTSQFMIFHTSDFTHYPHSGQTPSTIDFLLTNVNFAFDISVHENHMTSDHAPIICNANGSITHTHKIVYDFRKANWSRYQQLIHNAITDYQIPSTKNGLNDAIVRFTNAILSARSDSIPRKTNRSMSNSSRTQISPHTKQLIQRKNALKRIWSRTHSVPECKKRSRNWFVKKPTFNGRTNKKIYRKVIRKFGI